MKRLLLTLAASVAVAAGLGARDFESDFENATLRLDYVFCGDSDHQAIYFQQACRTSEWAGRRHHLSEPPCAHKRSYHKILNCFSRV